jgi:hypothetical protein
MASGRVMRCALCVGTRSTIECSFAVIDPPRTTYHA